MTVDKMLEVIQAYKDGKKVQRRKLTANIKDTMFRNATASRWEDVNAITEFNFSYTCTDRDILKYEYRIYREFKIEVSKEEEEAIERAENVANGTIVTDADEKKNIIRNLLFYYRTQKSHALNYGQLYYYAQDKLKDYEAGLKVQKETEPEREG